MGILKNYLDHQEIKDIPPKVFKNLDAAEDSINVLLKANQGKKDLEQALGSRMDDILGLVSRLKAHFNNWQWSLGKSISAFKFVYGIAIEVAQIVEDIKAETMPQGLSTEAERLWKIEFGKHLVWFVWQVWNPRFIKWVPEGIERLVQRRIVLWLAGQALDAAFDLFEKNGWFAAPKMIAASADNVSAGKFIIKAF